MPADLDKEFLAPICQNVQIPRSYLIDIFSEYARQSIDYEIPL